jgi:hypothetical protein
MERHRHFGRLALISGVVALISLAAAGPAVSPDPTFSPVSPPRLTVPAIEPLLEFPVAGDVGEYEALSGGAALAANNALPFSNAPLEAAAPFGRSSELGRVAGNASAIECLTAAVYYEAAGEGEKGQRAVAQVVLNRVRHPAFPSSVCGVVYQGSELSTGCQFTFTCDGSTQRTPSVRGWANARRVAVDALHGSVEPAVGMATHYHADYVFPHWAPRLSKVAAIGTHIFYRWNGFWGTRRAFTQAYSGENSGQPFIETAQVLDPDTDALDIVTSGGISQAQRPETEIVADSHRRVRLRADEGVGELKVDGASRELVADLESGATGAALNR